MTHGVLCRSAAKEDRIEVISAESRTHRTGENSWWRNLCGAETWRCSGYPQDGTACCTTTPHRRIRTPSFLHRETMQAEIAEFSCCESQLVFLSSHVVLEGCQHDSRPRSARCLRIVVHGLFRGVPKPLLLLRPWRFHAVTVPPWAGCFIVRGDSMYYCHCQALALFPLLKAPSIDHLIRLPIVLRSFCPSCFP